MDTANVNGGNFDTGSTSFNYDDDAPIMTPSIILRFIPVVKATRTGKQSLSSQWYI